jgi:hypothetical protein
MQLRDLDRRITEARLVLLDPRSEPAERANAVAFARELVPSTDMRLMVLAGIHWVASNPDRRSRSKWTTEDDDLASDAASWVVLHLRRLDREDDANSVEDASYEHAAVIARAIKLWTRKRGGRSADGSKWHAAYEAVRALGFVKAPVNPSRADALRKLWEGSRPRRTDGK